MNRYQLPKIIIGKIGGVGIRRTARGNTLILILAVTVGIIMTLLLFALAYTRLLGTHQEQKTAIEASSLAAAREMSKIVVFDNVCGYVSLSDSAPNGAGTMPQSGLSDQYPVPVKGINTMIGTARLDLIIADRIAQHTPPTGCAAYDMSDMEQLALQDLNNALRAWDPSIAAGTGTGLRQVLEASLTPSGSPQAVDIHGAQVRPYDMALLAYNQNDIRMNGESSYVSGSLQLTLGCIQGGAATNIPVPRETGGASTTTCPAAARVSSNVIPGFVYLSYTSVPYTTAAGTTGNFVFGGIGDSVRLIDTRKWVATVAGLPYQIPTIVKAEADQLIKDMHNSTGKPIHAAACAQPASVYDPKPKPGALSISFPDGQPSGITTPGHLLAHPQMVDNTNDADCLTAVNGDYPSDLPTASISQTNHPLDSTGAVNMRPIGKVWQVALHDWLRRAGVKADIQAVVAMQDRVLSSPTTASVTWNPLTVAGPPPTTAVSLGPIAAGRIHVFRFDNDGWISYEGKPHKPWPLPVLADAQFYAESLDALNAAPTADFPPGGTTPTVSITAVVFNDKGVGKAKGQQDTFNDTLRFTPLWDAYIRDEVRNPATGKHSGEPLDNTQVAVAPSSNQSVATGANLEERLKGAKIAINGDEGTFPIATLGYGSGSKKYGKNGGAIPILTVQSDFSETMVTLLNYPKSTVYTQYDNGGTGGAVVRPTYRNNGTAVDIRFRRQVNVGALAQALGFEIGYVGDGVGNP